MRSLQLPLLLCCICALVVARNSGKREVGPPQLVRGGFAVSNGPYGNEASASSLNYQAGNQGNYNNVDYNNYRNYNPTQAQNIPVQEQPDVPSQNVRVPVWSPPSASQNPYTAPPQPQAYPVPQTELIQVPVQQAVQGPYQQQSPYQYDQQQSPQSPYQQDQQQAYIPQQQPQEGYADQRNLPQQFSAAPQTYSNNAPLYLGTSSSVNDPSLYNSGQVSGPSIGAPPSSPYQVPPQSHLSPSVSSAANIAASYSSGLQPSLPPLHGRGLVSRLKGPPRFVGKSFGNAASSSFDGRLRSLDEVIGGGIGDFHSSPFGGSEEFNLGSFGSNYFSGLGGGFNSFGGSFPGFSIGGLAGLSGSLFPKFSTLGSTPGASIGNSIPNDVKIPSGLNNQASIPQNAIPNSDASASSHTSPPNANAISQAPQTPPPKN